MIKGKIIYNKKKVLILVKTTYITGSNTRFLILVSVGVKRTNVLARYINWLERVETSKK